MRGGRSFPARQPCVRAACRRVRGTLIAAERWQDLLNFVDLVERDAPNQCTVMFPEEVVPYEWESIREAALEALGRGGELVAMYQERLDDTYDPNTELNRMKLQAWTQAKE